MPAGAFARPDARSDAQPEVFPFFDQASSTFSYIVKDPQSSACAVVDSVLDFDYASGALSYESADAMIAFIREQDLKVELILETHVHADHLSAAPYIQSMIGGKIAISKHIIEVQNAFGKLFNEGTEFERDGSQFDILFEEDATYQIGQLQGVAMYTPGHTPACITHYIGNVAFVGDTLFMPDGGTARADFPGGDARQLYRSIKRIMALPADTRLYMCHDYQPNGRELAYLSSVAEQYEHNIHVHKGIDEETFVKMRLDRDATLGMPRLIYPSLQVNMRAGHFPEAESNDQIYLKVPVSAVKPSQL